MATATEAKQQDIVKIVDSPGLKAQILRQLPKQIDMDRFVRICITTIRTNPKLQQCEPLSIISSVMEASALGLELDPLLGHGYLVPFFSSERRMHICTFIPGFRGFVHLMRNSGLVSGANGEIVRRGDEFQISLGSRRELVHVPDFKAEDRDLEKNWIGAYATVVFKDGYRDFEYMTADELNAIGNASRSRGKGHSKWERLKDPHDTNDLGEMWKKTPIRRIAKRMPLSPENREIIRAATMDEIKDTLDPNKLPVAPMIDGAEDPTVALSESSSAWPPGTKEQEPAKKEEAKETVQRKSEKGKEKAESAKKETPPEFISQGQQRSITKLAMEEKGMDKAAFMNFLGGLGYENLETIQKKDFARAWQELVREPSRKK